MKIFFHFSPKINKNRVIATKKAIIESEYELINDWYSFYSDKNNKKTDLSLLYDQIMSEILSADVTVFDISEKDIDLGFQIAFSLQKNKPTLILKEKSIDHDFLDGLDSYLLTIKECDIQSISRVVKNYLNNNADETKIRFNLVINKKQDNYIEWAAFNFNSSKTEIIKKAIDEMIQKDKVYQKQIKQN